MKFLETSLKFSREKQVKFLTRVARETWISSNVQLTSPRYSPLASSPLFNAHRPMNSTFLILTFPRRRHFFQSHPKKADGSGKEIASLQDEYAQMEEKIFWHLDASELQILRAFKFSLKTFAALIHGGS
jgi:hypothetical protein